MAAADPSPLEAIPDREAAEAAGVTEFVEVAKEVLLEGIVVAEDPVEQATIG